MNEKLYKALLLLSAVCLLVILIFIWQEEDHCSKAGGVRMRELVGSWNCLDIKSLKDLK